MAKISRPQESYDAELAEKGLVRTYRIEISESGCPIYRENIIKLSELKTDRTPWWKTKKKGKK